MVFDKRNRERGQLRIVKTVVEHTHNDGDRWRVNQEINIRQKRSQTSNDRAPETIVDCNIKKCEHLKNVALANGIEGES